MSFLTRLKAQINPFDNGATFSNPKPQIPLYRGALNIPTAGPGTTLQSGPGVQYQQPQALNQPGLIPGLTPQTSPGLTYQQPITLNQPGLAPGLSPMTSPGLNYQQSPQVSRNIDISLQPQGYGEDSSYGPSQQGFTPYNSDIAHFQSGNLGPNIGSGYAQNPHETTLQGRQNPGFSPLQGTHSFLPTSFYRRKR